MQHTVFGKRIDRRRTNSRSRAWSLRQREQAAGILFALPAILGFVLWAAGPMIASLVISLTDWSLLTPPHWVGLENYVGGVTPSHPIPGMATDPLFWTSLRATLYYTGATLPLTMVVGFIIALLLSKPIRLAALFRTIYYLPAVLPAVGTAIAWLWLFNPQFGLFNALLSAVGLPTSQWIFNEATAMPSLILINVWGSGTLMLTFLAAIKGVPRERLEAAAMDGAGSVMSVWHVTVPAVSPVILFNLVTALIATFAGGFTQGLIITNGGPNNATLLFVLYLYREAFQNGLFGYGAAMSWVMFALLLTATLAILGVARRYVYYEYGGH